MNHLEIIDDLEQRLFSLHPKAMGYYNTIRTLKDTYDEHGLTDLIQFPKAGVTKPKRISYNKSDKTANKILFVLNELTVFSRIGDVLNRIKEYEPAFNTGLNTPINILKADNQIVVEKPTSSNRDTFYGLKSWLGDDGKPKAEHMYDKNTIVSKEYINLEDLN